jgi:hypothetical protein
MKKTFWLYDQFDRVITSVRVEFANQAKLRALDIHDLLLKLGAQSFVQQFGNNNSL